MSHLAVAGRPTALAAARGARRCAPPAGPPAASAAGVAAAAAAAAAGLPQLAPAARPPGRRRASGLRARAGTSGAEPFAQGPPLRGFADMSLLEQRLDAQFREMDAQFDRAFADMDRVQRQLDAELARGLRELQQDYQQPGVRIERREERAPGAYRYYESIQIRSGGMAVLTPAHTHAAAGWFSPLLFGALVLAGAWAALTAAFSRGFELTTYRRSDKWKLLALWPALLPLSAAFRSQFSSALRGERVRVLDGGEGRGGEGVRG